MGTLQKMVKLIKHIKHICCCKWDELDSVGESDGLDIFDSSPPPPPPHHHHRDLYCNVMHRWWRFAAKLMSFVHHA